MRGKRVFWAVIGALLAVWLGATTVDGLAQRLGAPPDGSAAPVPPLVTVTPGPDQRPVPRYGPSWIPPEPEGPPGSVALVPPPTRERVVPKPPMAPGPRGMPAPAPPTPGGPAPFAPAPPVAVPGLPAAVPTQPLPREVAPAAAPAAGAAAAAPPVPGTPTGPTDTVPVPVPTAGPPPVESAGVPSCGWCLAGTWVAQGEYTGGRLVGQAYRTTLSFRQFGSHLVGAQADDTITYYGRCSVDSLELEVWTGWDYIGRQTGSVAADGLSIAANWSLWSPETMEGHETLNGRARRAR